MNLLVNFETDSTDYIYCKIIHHYWNRVYGYVGHTLTNIKVPRVEVKSVPCVSTRYGKSTCGEMRKFKNICACMQMHTTTMQRNSAGKNHKRYYLQHEWMC